MDCCNYMQYRHPYYGPQFYENGLYGRDYYGHPYQSYYANSHYYSQQWPCAAPFADYVYNPKEARIRKAMREASRERVVGTAPIPSPRGGRRPQTWTNNPEEQLMMAPSAELGNSLCGSSIFAGPTSSVGQFMQPINSYTKLVHVLPPSSWIQDSPTYLQHNPIAELQQHQANMWQQYQDPIRHCTGPTYMLDNQINIYQDANPTDMSTHKKCKSEVDVFSNNSEAALSCKNKSENVIKNEKIDENSDRIDNDHETIVNSRDTEQSEKFLSVFQETVVVQNPFDKDDAVKLKKPSIPRLSQNDIKQSIKVLPDFNEAFGSTERGRFQSPPDPRLALSKNYLDCFFLNDYHV